MKVQKDINNLSTILKLKFHHVCEYSFQKIIKQVVLQVKVVDQEVKSNLEESKVVHKHDRSKSFSRIKEEKENCPPLGISIVSIGSSKVTR